jgi:cysteine desulfurase
MDSCHAAPDTLAGMSRYFDAASGLPLRAEARAALDAALDHGWADPARLHRDGRVARQLLDAARASIATSLGVLPSEVFLTSSGTAALQSGLLGLARGRRARGRTVVAGAVEHSAVLRAADWVMEGAEPVLVPVNPHGEVEVQRFAEAVTSSGVAVACLQHVNHEVGTVQPLAPAHAAAREAEVPLLVDACASLGAMPPPTDWDVLAGSAHKWGGPAGVGVLAIRTGTRWRSPLPTDPGGRPAGFPDVPGAVAAATALEHATRELARSAASRERLVGILRRTVPTLAEDVSVLGPDQGRAPHITCFTVLYADGEVLVGELDRAGFAVSSGSACTADTRRPSHVLAAMGAVTHGNLRVSLPPDAAQEDVDAFLGALPHAIAAARDAGERRAR